MKPFRGKHVAENLASQVFDKHPGVGSPDECHGSHKQAQAFWRKTMNNYGSDSRVQEFGSRGTIMRS